MRVPLIIGYAMLLAGLILAGLVVGNIISELSQPQPVPVCFDREALTQGRIPLENGE